ncbi:hypothetical protein AB0F17_44830 [Nonomuraea sp. NPDC026600]|uniref:hypothetical protein n=1 Tax=Nonomuraea sp. NPDC026600 TaxID=3155363 RepID=UPI0033F7754E
MLDDGALLGVPIAVPEAAPGWPAYDPDEVRQDRLRDRGSPPEWVEEAMTDAAEGRALIPTVFHSGREDVADLAARILSWTRDRPGAQGRPGIRAS